MDKLAAWAINSDDLLRPIPATMESTPAVKSDAVTQPGTSAIKTNALPEKHWPFLDFIRFAAALLVLFGHSRGLLLEGIGRVEHPNVFVRGLYLISGLQHEGVVLFFIVSGFLVGGSAWRMQSAGRFDFGTYFVNRFARIYLVYIPALALVLLIDFLGKHYFIDSRFYGLRPLPPSNLYDDWMWSQIPCHLAALQGILCTPWGVNPPVWSLGYEWAFYLIAPAVFSLLLMPMRRKGADLFIVAVILIALTWWNADWLTWFLMWLLGAFAAKMFKKKKIGISIGLIGLACCGGAIIVSRLAILPQGVTDWIVALGIAAAIASPPLMKISAGIPGVQRGAGFSYSLYLIHLPVCVFIGALYERLLQWPGQLVQPDVKGIAGFVGMTAMALIVAYLFARFTEDHTAAFRRKLMQWRARLMG